MAKITEYKTEDGSLTYYNSAFDEHYHSKTGAIEEAFEKYAKPAELAVVEKSEVALLDFCFGLGYNSLAALVELMKNKNVEKIIIHGIEIDHDILAKIATIDMAFPEWKIIQQAVKDKEYALQRDGKIIELKLFVDDARNIVPTLDADAYDFVFFDPFSPKKCPELWTEAIFSDVYRAMKSEGMLATYSCARKVRDAMKAVGFTVTDGPQVKRWAPSTLAYK